MMTGGKLCRSKNLDQVSTLGAEPEERERKREREIVTHGGFLHFLQWGRCGSAVKTLDHI